MLLFCQLLNKLNLSTYLYFTKIFDSKFEHIEIVHHTLYLKCFFEHKSINEHNPNEFTEKHCIMQLEF